MIINAVLIGLLAVITAVVVAVFATTLNKAKNGKRTALWIKKNEQDEGETEMKKDIFKKLNYYQKKFNKRAKPNESEIYNSEIQRIKQRILSDINHSAEIIMEEYLPFIRGDISGKQFTQEEIIKSIAVDDIFDTLRDSKPLKGVKQ